MLMWAADFADYLLWVREPLSSHFFYSSAWAQWRDLLFFFSGLGRKDRREACDSFLLCFVEVLGLVSSGPFSESVYILLPDIPSMSYTRELEKTELPYQYSTIYSLLAFSV
jgi:hypothetical protein